MPSLRLDELYELIREENDELTDQELLEKEKFKTQLKLKKLPKLESHDN